MATTSLPVFPVMEGANVYDHSTPTSWRLLVFISVKVPSNYQNTEIVNLMLRAMQTPAGVSSWCHDETFLTCS